MAGSLAFDSRRYAVLCETPPTPRRGSAGLTERLVWSVASLALAYGCSGTTGFGFRLALGERPPMVGACATPGVLARGPEGPGVGERCTCIPDEGFTLGVARALAGVVARGGGGVCALGGGGVDARGGVGRFPVNGRGR